MDESSRFKFLKKFLKYISFIGGLLLTIYGLLARFQYDLPIFLENDIIANVFLIISLIARSSTIIIVEEFIYGTLIIILKIEFVCR